LAPEIPQVAQAADDKQNKFWMNTDGRNTPQPAFSDEKTDEMEQ
jgi:hypothetical protein